ncbi:Conserved_hypothetical protein [Hexamita inflata]|uniref:Transmembrane protein n=1 Tax=Hexamita inflata TaxID=28002 RepID=A0AA86UWA4_9EUKA|nr:Conserved hypothetical protein [Hexamita inflata]
MLIFQILILAFDTTVFDQSQTIISSPVSLQSVLNGILKDPQLFQTHNFTQLRQNRLFLQNYMDFQAQKLIQLQQQLQSNSLSFKNFNYLHNEIYLSGESYQSFSYFKGTDPASFQLVYNLSAPNPGSFDPVPSFTQANDPFPEFSPLEETIVSDIRSNSFTFPSNRENQEFDGTGLLTGLVFSKLDKAVFYVDVSKGLGNQLRNNLDHFSVALELVGPYVEIDVYSVGEVVKQVFSGRAKDVRTKYIFQMFEEDDKVDYISGKLVADHIQKIGAKYNGTGTMVQVFVIAQAISVKKNNKPSCKLTDNIKVVVISTKIVHQKVNNQFDNKIISKNKYYATYQNIQSLVNSSVSQFNYLQECEVIELLLETIEMTGQKQYLQELRYHIIQVLQKYLSNEIQLSQPIVSSSSLNKQKVLYYVLPVVKDNKLLGIVAKSISVFQIYEMIVSQHLEYFVSNLFFIPQQYSQYNLSLEMQIRQRKYIESQEIETNIQDSFIQLNFEKNKILQSYLNTNDNIFLNNNTLTKVNDKTKLTGLSNLVVLNRLSKDTIQFNDQLSFIETVNTSYSEAKYIFTDYSTNSSKQLLYIGEQCYIDSNQYLMLFKLKYNEHSLIKYDNCTLFKEVMKTNQCLKYYDDNITIKIPFQNLQFYQNNVLLNPYILNQAQVYKELEKLEIKDILQLSNSDLTASALTQYLLTIPNLNIQVKITQQLLFQIKFQRLMFYIAQENLKNIQTQPICIYSQFNQMFTCSNENNKQNIEIFDASMQKYQRFDFGNKQWLVNHDKDEFPSNCYASWLLINKQSTSKLLLTNSFHHSESIIKYSKYIGTKSLVLTNPLSEPYNYSPYLFMEQIYDQRSLEQSIFGSNQEFIIDAGAFIVLHNNQVSQRQQQEQLNQFNMFDSHICQQFGQSWYMVDILFRAGVLQASYIITAGKFCMRYAIVSNDSYSFTIDNINFKLDRISDSLLFKLQILTPDMYNLFQDVKPSTCFSSMNGLNTFLTKYLKKYDFKFEISSTRMYEFTNAYTLKQQIIEPPFTLKQELTDVKQSSSARVIFYLIVLVTALMFVTLNSNWIN